LKKAFKNHDLNVDKISYLLLEGMKFRQGSI